VYSVALVAALSAPSESVVVGGLVGAGDLDVVGTFGVFFLIGLSMIGEFDFLFC